MKIVHLGNQCGEAIPHFCISGSNNVFVNGKPVCRKGDNFTEGRVLIEGSKTVFANGFGVGRVGDMVYNAPHKLDQKKMVDPSRKVKG